jgi:hypothetical protein
VNESLTSGEQPQRPDADHMAFTSAAGRAAMLCAGSAGIASAPLLPEAVPARAAVLGRRAPAP